ncbi:MAG: phospho-N-acetylmuramoyl-pentapeptide-transferase [bacterium]|nr:phospho-N-acetylmuramoyl-pentapeptide-transferase [bacterium]
MLYDLLYPLHTKYFFFHLFKYITFRAAYAGATGLLISLICGKYVIRWLTKRKILAQVREKGIKSQETKTHIPTMGGLLLMFAVSVSALLWCDLKEPFVWVILISSLAFGAIGVVDDMRKIKLHKGISKLQKFLPQIIIGLLVGAYVYFFPKDLSFRSYTTVLFLKNWFVYLDWFYIPFVVIVLIAVTNATNLTDGLDGLAIGLGAEAIFAFLVLAYAVGNLNFSQYLGIIHIPGAGEITVFLAGAAGAALGFLWYNTSPAQIIMGDTGALMLGGIIGVAAVLIKQEVLLLLACGPYAIETMSVILQIAYFKRTHGKRLFRMAPIHHHYEKKGLPENKIVVRFWIIGILFLVVCLSTLKIR